jgi:hypothetical protein
LRKPLGDQRSENQLQRSFLSSAVSFEQPSLASLLLFSRRLCNTELEYLIVLSSSFSALDSLSTKILSQLSIEALDELLSSRSLVIESENPLLSFVVNLGSSYSPLVRHIQFQFLSSARICQLCDCFATCDLSESLWCRFASFLIRPRVWSLIVSDVPTLFDEFCDKRWSLFWRGTRDFHSRCDGHANTVTLIETAASRYDFGGFVFGGFHPRRVGVDTTMDWQKPGAFSFHAEKSTQHLPKEVCAEGR